MCIHSWRNDKLIQCIKEKLPKTSQTMVKNIVVTGHFLQKLEV